VNNRFTNPRVQKNVDIDIELINFYSEISIMISIRMHHPDNLYNFYIKILKIFNGSFMVYCVTANLKFGTRQFLKTLLTPMIFMSTLQISWIKIESLKQKYIN